MIAVETSQWLLLVSALTALLLAGLLVTVLRRNPGEPAVWTFAGGVLVLIGFSLEPLLLAWRPDTFPDLIELRYRLLESGLLLACWSYFSLHFGRRPALWKSALFAVLLLVTLALLLTLETPYMVPAPGSMEPMFPLNLQGKVVVFLFLLAAISGLLNLESTYRASTSAQKWQIRYLVLAVAGILAYLVFRFSITLLYGHMEVYQPPLPLGVILVVAMILGFAVVRNQAFNIEIFVSRYVIYNSLTLLIVGGFLVLAGVVGQLLRALGGELGESLQTLFIFAAAMAGLALFLSEQVRRRLKVLVNKHFYKNKYDYREQWLALTQRLNAQHRLPDIGEQLLEHIAQSMGFDAGSLWLCDLEEGSAAQFRLISTRHTTPDLQALAPDLGIIQHLRDSRRVVNLLESGADLLSDSLLQNLEPELISPLFYGEKLVGFMTLAKNLHGSDYNYEDYDLLKTLGHQAAGAVVNIQLAERLGQAKEFEALARVTSFVMHDLKNATASLSLLMQNADRHLANPEFQQDLLKAVQSSVERIKTLINRLSAVPKEISVKLSEVDAAAFTQQVLGQFHHDPAQLRVEVQGEAQCKLWADPDLLSTVLLNLLINAREVMDNCGQIVVSWHQQGGGPCVSVRDHGPGMSADFITGRLFRPFQSTKSQGLGIGLYQSKLLVEAMGGEIGCDSSPGQGAIFWVRLRGVE